MNAISLPIVPLALETRSALPTHEATIHLNRRQQSIRIWACYQNGPIRPLRIHGRLAWPVAEPRRLVGSVKPTSHKN